MRSFHKGHIRLLGWVCLYCFLLGSIARFEWFAILSLFVGFGCIVAICIDADAQEWPEGTRQWYLQQEDDENFTLFSRRQGSLFSEAHGSFQSIDEAILEKMKLENELKSLPRKKRRIKL